MTAQMTSKTTRMMGKTLLLLLVVSVGCGPASEDELATLLASGDGKGDSVDLQLICDLVYSEPQVCSDRCNLPADFAQRLIAAGVPAEDVPTCDDPSPKSCPPTGAPYAPGSICLVPYPNCGWCWAVTPRRHVYDPPDCLCGGFGDPWIAGVYQ